MQVTTKRYANVVVVASMGRIDYQNAEAFREALMPHIERCGVDGDLIVLDLSGLEYISSAGLRVLMIAAKEARARNGKLLAVTLQPVVREIFEISRFTLVFEIYDSVRDALARISAPALSAFDAGQPR